MGEVRTLPVQPRLQREPNAAQRRMLRRLAHWHSTAAEGLGLLGAPPAAFADLQRIEEAMRAAISEGTPTPIYPPSVSG